ncbi:MAG: mannitol dehydrogenase family protein, partial [Pseudomonas helleri]
MKLNRRNLDNLTPKVAKPTYLDSDTQHGIAHFGVGGFHRAHQAFYTDALMDQGRDLDWSICGIGLRPEDRKVRDDLAGQDYLYTLFELGDSDDTQSRIIGSISNMLLAEDSIQAVIDKLASPHIRIVSLTITEGGYCIDDSTGEFMAQLPQIQQDLAQPHAPRTVFGVLCAALAQRRANHTPAFTVMSCDNLPHNGNVARKALLAFAALSNPDLHDWIAANVSFPNAMV